MIADRLIIRTPAASQEPGPQTTHALELVRHVLVDSGLERTTGPGPEQWWWNPDKGPGIHATLHPTGTGLEVRLTQDLYGPIGPTPKYRDVKQALTEATVRTFGKGAVRVE
jgi:hypothetical protein